MNELLLRQLVHADKILINKVDQLKQESKAQVLEDIHSSIKHVNKHALIQETTYAQASLEFLLDKAQDSGVQQELRLALKDNHKLSHRIMDEIKSVYIKIDEQMQLDKDKLENYIGTLLWEGPSTLNIQVMRCKGIFTEAQSGKPYMLQGVEDLFEFREVNG